MTALPGNEEEPDLAAKETLGLIAVSHASKNAKGETTYYIGSGFEHYSLGGVGHEYIHRDHLGSVTPYR